MSVLSATKAEQAAQLISGQTFLIQPHDDDPGATHDDNLSPGISAVVMADDDWGAFADDPTTSGAGGRVTKNTVELEFAEEATDDGSIAYVTYWEESDPVNAPGVYDQWFKTVELTEPVPYSMGNRVYVPVGSLEAFGAGSN